MQKVLLIDNYDSFTYNLAQLLDESKLCDFRIIKNDTALNSEYGTRADAIIDVTKHDIINSPNCSHSFEPGLSTVFTIVSHYSTILLELYLSAISFFGSLPS